MEYLLSPKNIHLVESFSLVQTLLGFDFDGTLVPIAADPALVNLSEECEGYLRRLNETMPLAIITGRSVTDVRRFFTFKPKYIIGNHGIEGNHSREELEMIRDVVRRYRGMIEDQFEKELSRLGIQLEDKTYSITLHYRNSPTPELAEKFLLANLGYFSLAKVTKGKMVINIIPENGATKGQAFQKLLLKERAKFGLYIGDDDTDEDVFILKSSRLLTVRIGYSPTSHASYYLKSQEEIIRVLEILAGVESLA